MLINIPYIRANHWWSYKTTPILGFIYLYCSYFNMLPTQLVAVIFFFIVSYIGFAGTGYAINDIYDIEIDRKAGKRNPFEGKSKFFKFKLLFFLSLLAWAPWIYLRMPWYIIICFISLLLLLLTYSHPSTRFKEHPFCGPIWDAMYGHVLPVLITCFTFQQYVVKVPYNEWSFYLSLIIWQFFKGIRNILNHQLDDYDNDICSDTQTLVTIHGRTAIHHRIMVYILPLEIGSLIVFLMTISSQFKSIWAFIILFLLVYRFGHGLFKSKKWDKENHQKNSYLYFLNDFYELYLPYYFLLAFCFRQSEYILFLVVHILLFPTFLPKIWMEFSLAIVEFKNHVKDNIFVLLHRIFKKD
ncbi:MAG: UbiA family prenyltransferase [Chitinophagales bacterium]|nr:UbiA family prenyltransferase [Chitinophagales bacterium]